MIFEVHHGADIAKVVDQLAKLRMTVFREYPYLYDGNLMYEQNYLQSYVKSSRSLAVIAKTESQFVVGASTCLPLSDEESRLQGNFEGKGYDVSEIFYFGESVVLPMYRGAGLGKKFFEFRENHAKSFSTYKHTSFCSVVRPEGHPLKPQNYTSPEPLWQRLGYSKLQGITTQYSWPDFGEQDESEKLMQFWSKKIS